MQREQRDVLLALRDVFTKLTEENVVADVAAPFAEVAWSVARSCASHDRRL
jgi:hypothetical protein